MNPSGTGLFACRKTGLPENSFRFAIIFSRALHGTLFCSVQMVMVSKNHGFKLFAVMVFPLSRLKMYGSGESWIAAIRFTAHGPVCGLVTVRSTIPG